MRKLGLFIAFFITVNLMTQCTEDETIESAQYDAIQLLDKGGEGDQDLDDERD